MFFQKRIADPGRAAVDRDAPRSPSRAGVRPTSCARPTWRTWPGPRRWARSSSTRGRSARPTADHPDELRIDLDPQPGTDFGDAVAAAGVVREVLDELGWTGYPKTSGGRGVHVYVRIEPRWTFVEVRRAAIALAREVERRRPDLVTTAWWKEERGERVFLDYNQMARDRTIACAYSLRANARATVSTPVTWDELTEVEPDDFDLRTVPKRFAADRRPARRHRRRRRSTSRRCWSGSARDERGGPGRPALSAGPPEDAGRADAGAAQPQERPTTSSSRTASRRRDRRRAIISPSRQPRVGI